MAESVAILIFILLALTLCVAALSAIGQLGFFAPALAGGWQLQLFRLVWYPLTWVVVLALALVFYMAVAMSMEALEPWAEQWRRSRRSRAVKPYLASIENPNHRRLIGEIYRLGGAHGLHCVADAIAYPGAYGYLAYVAGFDVFSKGRSDAERLLPPPVSTPGGGCVNFGADEELHAVVTSGTLCYRDNTWEVDPAFAEELGRAVAIYPIAAGTWLRGASRAKATKSVT